MEILHDITEHEKDGMRFFAARTGVKDLISIEGSVHGGYYLLPLEVQMAPRLASGLFDADTKRHSKKSLRAMLATRGISLSFSVGADRTYFSATCFPEHLRTVCDTIVECLSEASFKKPELENERARTLGELEETKTQTHPLASAALSRMLFDKKHVNYDDPLADTIGRTKRVQRADLVSYQKSLGRGGLIFAVTGDVAPAQALRDAEKAFAKLPDGMRMPPEKPRNRKHVEAQTKLIRIADKANIDTFLGAPVALTNCHPLYLPFLVLTNMLGSRGLFAGHLMRTIRERDGLTYGINASAYGFTEGADGALRIWATFSPHNFDHAVSQTRKEIGWFFKNGITADTLLMEQDHTAGGYAVGLSTSRGLAATLHKIGREGKPLTYLDEYPHLVRAVTLDDLHAVAAFIPLDMLSLAAAGTFEKGKR